MRNLNLHLSKPSRWSYVRPHRHHVLLAKNSLHRSAVNSELKRWAHWFNAEGMMENNFGGAEELRRKEELVMSA